MNYFGESLENPCDHCDNCEAGIVEDNPPTTAEANGKHPFAMKSRINHSKYGEGTVMRYDDEKIVILFDTAGYKSLVTTFAVEKGLIAPV